MLLLYLYHHFISNKIYKTNLLIYPKTRAMAKIINILILSILALSISLNLFLRSNNEASCSNIDARRKADLLYFMGHRGLDGDKDGIPCENLPYNQK